MKMTVKTNLKSALLLTALTGACLALDRLALRLHGSVTLIQGVLGLRLTRNTGVAFSLLADSPALALTLTALVILALGIYTFRAKMSRFSRACLICALSGGLANLFERAFTGAVTDMLELLFIDFPVFNAADVCVCAGILAYAAGMIFSKEKTHDGV